MQYQYILQSGAVQFKSQYWRQKVNKGDHLYVCLTHFEVFFCNCCFTKHSGGRSRAVFITLSILEGTLSIEVVVEKSSNAKDFYKLSFKSVKAKVRWGCGLLLLMNIGTREDIKLSFKTYNILQLSFKASFSLPLIWVTWPWFYWLNFYSSPMNNLSYEQ